MPAAKIQCVHPKTHESQVLAASLFHWPLVEVLGGRKPRHTWHCCQAQKRGAMAAMQKPTQQVNVWRCKCCQSMDKPNTRLANLVHARKSTDTAEKTC